MTVGEKSMINFFHNYVIFMNHWEFLEPTTTQPCTAEDRAFEYCIKLCEKIKDKSDWSLILTGNKNNNKSPLKELILGMKNVITTIGDWQPMRKLCMERASRVYYVGMHTNNCCFTSALGINYLLPCLHQGSFSIEVIDECTAALDHDEKTGIFNNQLQYSGKEYMREQNLRKSFIENHLISYDQLLLRHNL